MKTINSSQKLKHFHQMRPSQSLHAHLNKTIKTETAKESLKRSQDEITICIIYKKKKIQFELKTKTTFK